MDSYRLVPANKNSFELQIDNLDDVELQQLLTDNVITSIMCNNSSWKLSVILLSYTAMQDMVRCITRLNELARINHTTYEFVLLDDLPLRCDDLLRLEAKITDMIFSLIQQAPRIKLVFQNAPGNNSHIKRWDEDFAKTPRQYICLSLDYSQITDTDDYYVNLANLDRIVLKEQIVYLCR